MDDRTKSPPGDAEEYVGIHPAVYAAFAELTDAETEAEAYMQMALDTFQPMLEGAAEAMQEIIEAFEAWRDRVLDGAGAVADNILDLLEQLERVYGYLDDLEAAQLRRRWKDARRRDVQVERDRNRQYERDRMNRCATVRGYVKIGGGRRTGTKKAKRRKSGKGNRHDAAG